MSRDPSDNSIPDDSHKESSDVENSLLESSLLKNKARNDEYIQRALENGSVHALDATGLICPEPVMLLHNLIRKIDAGEVVCVTATDASTQRDITRFCDFLNHPLLRFERQDAQFIFWIQKKIA